MLDGHLTLEEEHLVPVMLATGPESAVDRHHGGFGAAVPRWTVEGLDGATVHALADLAPVDLPALLSASAIETDLTWRDVPSARLYNS